MVHPWAGKRSTTLRSIRRGEPIDPFYGLFPVFRQAGSKLEYSFVRDIHSPHIPAWIDFLAKIPKGEARSARNRSLRRHRRFATVFSGHCTASARNSHSADRRRSWNWDILHPPPSQRCPLRWSIDDSCPGDELSRWCNTLHKAPLDAYSHHWQSLSRRRCPPLYIVMR